MRRPYGLLWLSIFISILIIPVAVNADNTLLSPEETLWLKSRNNTIVVYPVKNYPPYSYENSSRIPQGLSIDYIELIISKVGGKIQYLQARPISQILEDVKQGKGDVVTSIDSTKDREQFLYFTDNYVTVPAVIVVRKDSNLNIRSLNDLVGRKVSIGDQYAVEDYVRENNPRIIIESMTDDEASLQQLVLGEVDAAIMDVASLSYYVSKQVLSSVKVIASTGFDYKLTFAVPKDKKILQSILDKGLQQISIKEREILNDKWIIIPNERNKIGNSFYDKMNNLFSIPTFQLFFAIGLATIVIVAIRKRKYSTILKRKSNGIGDLKEEIKELEETSETLVHELENVKNLEKDIKQKIESIEK